MSVVVVVVAGGTDCAACAAKAAGPAVSILDPIVYLVAANGVSESSSETPGDVGCYLCLVAGAVSPLSGALAEAETASEAVDRVWLVLRCVRWLFLRSVWLCLCGVMLILLLFLSNLY